MNIEELKKEYAEQDNRATAYPIYVTVQELVPVGVIAEGYDIINDGTIKYGHNCESCDKCCDPEPEHCEYDMPMGYIWKDVEFFLAIKGANEYMKANQHNHGELRTYVKYFERRNFEMWGLLKELGFKTDDRVNENGDNMSWFNRNVDEVKEHAPEVFRRVRFKIVGYDCGLINITERII